MKIAIVNNVSDDIIILDGFSNQNWFSVPESPEQIPKSVTGPIQGVLDVPSKLDRSTAEEKRWSTYQNGTGYWQLEDNEFDNKKVSSKLISMTKDHVSLSCFLEFLAAWLIQKTLWNFNKYPGLSQILAQDLGQGPSALIPGEPASSLETPGASLDP